MHDCIQEKAIDRVEQQVGKIFSTIEGNGTTGMKTDLALIKQKLDSMPSPNQLRLFSLLGGGASVFVIYLGGMALKVLA